MSAGASRCARRKLALRLGTPSLARRLWDDSGRSPRRAIGPGELIRRHGSTWTEVDAEGSLRASFCCAVQRRAPQVGIIRHAGVPQRTSGVPPVGRVCQADADRRRKSGGAIHPRVFPQRVRVVTSQRDRFEPCAACRLESSTRRAGGVRGTSEGRFPGRSIRGRRAACRWSALADWVGDGPPTATDIKRWFEYRVGSL
jgi:hypothetical protein